MRLDLNVPEVLVVVFTGGWRRIMNKRARRNLTAALMLCACPFTPLLASAQIPFTNSATLTLTLSGSNLLLCADFDSTNGEFTVIQGDRPDGLTLPACSCQISNQILDIGWTRLRGISL